MSPRRRMNRLARKTRSKTEAEPAPEPTPIPAVDLPDLVLSMDGATDKGALALNVVTKDELTEADEVHGYTFAAVDGQTVNIKIRTGGGRLEWREPQLALRHDLWTGRRVYGITWRYCCPPATQLQCATHFESRDLQHHRRVG